MTELYDDITVPECLGLLWDRSAVGSEVYFSIGVVTGTRFDLYLYGVFRNKKKNIPVL